MIYSRYREDKEELLYPAFQKYTQTFNTRYSDYLLLALTIYAFRDNTFILNHLISNTYSFQNTCLHEQHIYIELFSFLSSDRLNQKRWIAIFQKNMSIDIRKILGKQMKLQVNLKLE